ncbi:hypothetical protein F5144DRAFT_586426 [Chaetomium tenue]|uniref:Uncharacterized protein n=1 Tax=Chaetomium tenue TaxID=1854479 RepID=A0ACB7NVA1_9PEZI|nr:hypothetical protein F5144DRAFT_586426 [Chaetomium globosum]
MYLPLLLTNFMDPISALSLAAAAAQFIELALKVVSRLADFGANVDQAPKAFRQIMTELPLIIEGLKRIEERSREGGQGDSGSSAAVCLVINECQEVVKQLDELLDKILPSPGASSFGRGWKAVASLASDAKVEELAKSLTKYIQTLTFHQIVVSTTGPASTAAETQKPETWWLVPFDRNSSFVGREEIFKAIDTTLIVKEDVQPRAALWGLGGIGKSQIALEYCHRIRQRNLRCSIFWVNAATISRFEESYKRIAVECGLVERNESNSSDVSFLVQNWLQTTHIEPWLMVIDNVDDKDSFFYYTLPNGNTPSQCIPTCAHGSLLFTTRTSDIAFDLATPAVPIAIPQMTSQEGNQLVKERLRRAPGPLDNTTIGELLDEVEYIPLAITQAISFISKRGTTIPQYLERYRQSDATRTRMLTFEFAEHGRQIGSLESVAKTWTITFKWLRSNSPRAADLLCLLSFFQHQAIPRQLLLTPKGEAREGVAAKEQETEEMEEDGFDFEDALDTLCAFSLLDTGGSVSANVFTTHHLVQLATRWWLQNENPKEESRWALVALQSISRHFPADEMAAPTGYWSLCEGLFPHAELALAYDFRSQGLPDRQRIIDLARAKLLVATGHYLVWTSAFDEALSRLEESVALRTRHLGERDVNTLASMGQVAWFHSLIVRNPARAIPLGRRVLALRTELLGVDHEQTIDSMCDLGGALEENEEYIESETLLREAIERGTRTIGPRSLLVLNCTALLAGAVENQGRLAEAVELYRLVHEEKRDIDGPEDIRVLIAESHLASALVRRKETREEGEALMRRTLAAKQRTLGPDHFETLASAWNLILALARASKFQEALAICDAFMAACEQGPRKNNPHSAALVEMIRDWREQFEGQERCG